LSKPFDRIDWATLWLALTEHGISEHVVWVMQCLYRNQHSRVQNGTELSKDFQIKTGVRQGSVLRPRLFTVLEWAMQKWRAKVEHVGAGIDFGNGLRRWLDVRFADAVLLFPRTTPNSRCGGLSPAAQRSRWATVPSSPRQPAAK
jgi:hypothetical protein